MTLIPFFSSSGSGTPQLFRQQSRAIASAMGERQVLPLQTNRIVVRSSRSMIRSSYTPGRTIS